MNRINYFLVALTVIMLSACEKKEVPSYPEPYQYWTPYTIADYLDGTLTLETIKQETPDYIGQRLDDEGIRLVFQNTVLYQDPNLREPQNTEQYMECAAKNGDIRDREYLLPYNYPSTKRAFAFNWRTLTVTSNKRYDAAHPAGQPLNDLIEFNGLTYGPYIESGYNMQVEEYKYVCKLLSECTINELSMLSANTWDFPRLYFLKSPDKKEEHTITVRLEADYGEPVRTASIRCIPVWRH